MAVVGAKLWATEEGYRGGVSPWILKIDVSLNFLRERLFSRKNNFGHPLEKFHNIVPLPTWEKIFPTHMH